MRSAFRSLLRGKVNLLINTVGLATGLGACIVIVLWVAAQYRVNKYLSEKSQICQVVTNYEINGSLQSARATSFPIISTLQTSVAGIATNCYARIEPEQYSLSTDPEKPGKEIAARGQSVSPNFFDFFNRPFLAGSRKSALQDPLSVVISEGLARRLFGADWKVTALGKTIYFGGAKEADITGVFEDFPQASTVRFEYGLPLPLDTADNIGNLNYDTYVQLRENLLPAQVQDQANRAIKEKTQSRLYLQPFKDTYLYSNFSNGRPEGGRIEYVRLFILAAAFILLMACINFMNLYIAGSFKRAKDVGIRRIIGAKKSAIFLQFLSESVLLTGISFVLSLFAVILCLPWINHVVEDNLAIPYQSVIFWIGLVGLLIVTALLAGLYPASLFTSVRPATAVRANNEIKIGGVGMRRSLFVFQFLVSLALIIFTYGMARQIGYLESKDLGYDKRNLIYKELSQNERMHLTAIRQTLMTQQFVQGVTVSSLDLQNGGPMVGGVDWPNKPANDSTNFAVIFTDTAFTRAMKIPVILSSDQQPSFTGNRVAVFLNESAAAIMGGREKIINHDIRVWGADGKVVGIVPDFHFNSLFSPIQPLILADFPSEARYLIVRVQQGRQQEAIEELAKIHREYTPSKMFAFDWLEDSFQQRYRNESNMDKIATLFSFLSVLIACLGLLGLANISVQKRTRELGIRKTLGASRYQIIILVFSEFSRLILIAILLAVPISWLLLANWLQKFAYRTPVSILTFGLPIALMVGIAIITLIYHAVRVTMINPISSIQEK